MKSPKLTSDHLRRRALVYVRQSTPNQVAGNLESQRRQYDLRNLALDMGFSDVIVVDEDLGRSGSGKTRRPGFERMFAALSAEEVGAVFCLEASRLARNGREWHMLVDICGMVGAVIIDPEGVYDPRISNDRLLLGLKGTLSEYELALLRQRAQTAIREKAARGELRFVLPVGLCWSADGRIELNPDLRIQNAIRLVFEKYKELGSVRQVLLWFHQEEVSFPTYRLNATRGSKGFDVRWGLPVHSTLHRTLTSPFYAGAYVWGRTTRKTTRAGKDAWEMKVMENWNVLLKDNHEGYITWKEYLELRKTMAENTHSNPWKRRKAGRGGRGLLAGLVRCRRCGRRLNVSYSGNGTPYYRCGGNRQQNGTGCIGFSGRHVDERIRAEVLAVVAAPAIEAAVVAANQAMQRSRDELATLDLELEQAEYQARLAERRYGAVDPDNRLVAPELERRWNAALAEVEAVKRRLERQNNPARQAPPNREQLLALAHRLPDVWDDPRTDMRTRQRIVRILVKEILVDLDADTGEVRLLIHWVGGRHSEARAKRRKDKPRSLTTDKTAVDVVKQMAMYCDDRQVAITLNRLGLKTYKGTAWTSSRVRNLRVRHGVTDDVVAANRAATEGFVTLVEAAQQLGTHSMAVRMLIRKKLIEAEQVVPFAPWRIRSNSLHTKAVAEALKRYSRPPRSRKKSGAEQNLTIPGI